MLNVLTLSTLYPNAVQPNFGGFVERQTIRLAAHPDVRLRVIAPIGDFFLPIGPYAALRNVPDSELRSGIEVRHPHFPVVPAIGWRLNPRNVARAVSASLTALADKGFRPDVIDCEFFWPDGPAAVAVGNAFNIPVSIKARGSDIRLWGQRPAARRMMVEAAGRAAGLLAVSQSLKNDMDAIGIPGERVTVHRTGIDLGRFTATGRQQDRMSLGVSGPLLLTVGNLVPLKRQHVIVEAVAALPGTTLFIAGAGPERTRLEALIAARGLGERVVLLGNVEHDAMPALMRAADVLVHAASSEGLANVWVEALASGTPIVTSRVGGAAEVIDSPAAGRLIDEVTPAVFAAAIADILSAPPAPEDVRRSALRFDWSNNTDSLYRYLSGLKR